MRSCERFYFLFPSYLKENYQLSLNLKFSIKQPMSANIYFVKCSRELHKNVSISLELFLFSFMNPRTTFL